MEKKHFLFVSVDALASDLAWHIKKEGHHVKMFIENSLVKDIADGFFDKTDNWEDEIDWADVIIFDDVLGHGTKAEALRKKGKKVVGGTAYTDMLEDDRTFGQEELKKLGIPIIPYKEFSDFELAIKYVTENPAAYVIKPSGEAQNIKRLLFVGEEEDGKDVLQVLEAYKRVWTDKIKIFQLQRRVKGVEVAVGAFFNGKEFITPININFEHKKLLPGNLGPSTGEMGTAMYWSGPNKIFNATLNKLAPKLASEGFVGYIDLNCIVNGTGIYPLEFTSRFGYPTISIQMEGISNQIGEFFFDLANNSPIKLKTKKGFQICVVCATPPFPYDDKSEMNIYKDLSIIF